ncbi:MAG: hypothetical protein M0Q42_03075 [Xanthomonadales bacterium]|nr:hypothetical protein [Xanthomonadales bacterium]
MHITRSRAQNAGQAGAVRSESNLEFVLNSHYSGSMLWPLTKLMVLSVLFAALTGLHPIALAVAGALWLATLVALLVSVFRLP